MQRKRNESGPGRRRDGASRSAPDSVSSVARRPRSWLPDGFFHLTTRGVQGLMIFEDAIDRIVFLQLLRRTIERHEWTCHAYCLMGTHYHLVIQTTVERLSAGMQDLNGTYAQQFNTRHQRH